MPIMNMGSITNKQGNCQYTIKAWNQSGIKTFYNSGNKTRMRNAYSTTNAPVPEASFNTC